MTQDQYRRASTHTDIYIYCRRCKHQILCAGGYPQEQHRQRFKQLVHMFTHAHTHIHTHSHILTHTHTHTQTHAQTHTHTPQVYVQSSLCWGLHTGAAQTEIQTTADLDGKVWAVSRESSFFCFPFKFNRDSLLGCVYN